MSRTTPPTIRRTMVRAILYESRAPRAKIASAHRGRRDRSHLGEELEHALVGPVLGGLAVGVEAADVRGHVLEGPAGRGHAHHLAGERPGDTDVPRGQLAGLEVVLDRAVDVGHRLAPGHDDL